MPYGSGTNKYVAPHTHRLTRTLDGGNGEHAGVGSPGVRVVGGVRLGGGGRAGDEESDEEGLGEHIVERGGRWCLRQWGAKGGTSRSGASAGIHMVYQYQLGRPQHNVVSFDIQQAPEKGGATREHRTRTHTQTRARANSRRCSGCTTTRTIGGRSIIVQCDNGKRIKKC